MKTLVDMKMFGFSAAIFSWFLCSFRAPSRTLVAYERKRGGMPLHNTIWVNCKNIIKAQVPSIWAKGCMIDKCVCVI